MVFALRERVPFHVRALGLYMLYQFFMSVGTTQGLTLALPTIMEEFDIPVTTAVWIMVAYSVALAGGTIAIGVVSTMFDKRKLIVLGILVDVGLMVMIFYTQNIYVFIVCRFLSAAFRVFPWLILQVEGIGGFPPEKRGKAVGYGALVQGISFMLSIPLAGFVLDQWGWRWLFMGTSAVFVLITPLIYLLLPKMPPDITKRKSLADFDLLGSVLMMVGMVTLLTALQFFARGYGSPIVMLGFGAMGALVLGVFFWVELHARAPILQLGLFRIPGVSLAASQAIVMGVTNGAFMLMMPFLFIQGYGWTAAYASSILFFQNIARPITGPVSGRLADRFGSPAVIFPSAVVSILGQLGLVALGVSPTVSLVVAVLIFWGTGQALMQTANLRQIYTSLPRNQLHLAPSLNLVVSTGGGTMGQALGSLAVERGRYADAGMASVLFVMMVTLTGVFFIGMIITQLLPRIFLRTQIAAATAAAQASASETRPTAQQ